MNGLRALPIAIGACIGIVTPSFCREAPDLKTQICRSIFPITPSDTTILDIGAIWVGTAGNLVIDDDDGHTNVTIPNVPVGLWPWGATKVRPASTASGLVGCR